MVRDGYSANGQPQQADGGAAVQPLDLRSSTANLTQELAQLLAQSIAQGQTGKRPPAPAAAGSELANLAALVSASQNQRGVQPSFKDGLSSLSYARPAPPPAPPPPAPTLAPPPGSSLMIAPMAPPANGLLVSEPHDEEPMPIPSTWRQPTVGDDDRWYRQQLGAAGLGLVAGLLVVVPAVLWLSGLLGGAQTKAVAARHQAAPEEAAPPVKVAAVKQIKVHVTAASADAAPSAPTVSAAPVAPPRARAAIMEPAPQTRVAAVPPPPPPPQEPVQSRADQLLEQARLRIERGDITGARQILQADETATSADMTFLLAETFDPNMLASWQTRGITANPQRARALYERAYKLGHDKAQQRLDWLTAN